MSTPDRGITVRPHVQQLLADAEMALSAISRRIAEDRPMRKAEREQCWRSLAGVGGSIETVRLWLDAGAPR